MHQQFVFQWAVFLQIYELLIIKTFSFVKEIFIANNINFNTIFN